MKQLTPQAKAFRVGRRLQAALGAHPDDAAIVSLDRALARASDTPSTPSEPVQPYLRAAICEAWAARRRAVARPAVAHRVPFAGRIS